jgi:natural product precursor
MLFADASLAKIKLNQISKDKLGKREMSHLIGWR